jgi:micrococcal nuclease
MKTTPGSLLLTFLWLLRSAALADDAPAGAAVCAPDQPRSATVVEVVNHETLLLDDGRVLRFAGILFPHYSEHGGAVVETAQAVTAAIKPLVLGRQIQLRLGAQTPDRYGRAVAHITVIGLEGDAWLQRRLVAMGLAIAAPSSDDAPCQPQLQKAEDEARKHGAGFWGQKLFRVRQVDEIAGTQALANSFQLVEGVIRRVSGGKGATYVNLGVSREKSFTAIIESKHRKSFAAPALDISQLRGKRVRMRGWLQIRGEMMLVLVQAGQIEVLEGGDGEHR